MRVNFGPLLFGSVSSKTYLCLANNSIKVNSFWSAFLWGRFSILFSVPSPPVWVICNGCNLLLFHLFSVHLPDIRSFLLHPSISIPSSFQCSVFTCTFNMPIFSDFIFFSVLSVHISRLTSPSVVLGGDPLTIDCDFDYQVKHWHTWHMIM